MNVKHKSLWTKIFILIFTLCIFLFYFLQINYNGSDKSHSYDEESILKENERASLRAETSDTQDNVSTVDATPEQTAEESAAADIQQIIRVLIKTNDFKEYYHSEISLIGSEDYQITGSTTETLAAGEVLNIDSNSPYFADDVIQIQPITESGSICLLSVQREQGNPSYQGNITIYRDENGLRIVNELPLETYLYAVVPSEMPASYSEEALKAQAVCARTYAFVQLQENSLDDLGAHVDDSVSFQVYQNLAPDERTTKAVEETKGQILCNNNTPIDAYYFSTSHGKTSTDEVWEAAVPASYLKSVVCEYDQEEPWYQWEVNFSKEELLARIQEKYPEIKELQKLSIVEVGEGEAVLTIKIESSKQSILVHNENTIRQLLSPEGLLITRKDGSTVTGGDLLPSAYFTLEENTDGENVTGYTIYGGGYGHGVGLSQNGAQHMALEGSGYEDILTYFYNEVAIMQVSDINQGSS